MTTHEKSGHLQPRLSALNMLAMAFAILNTWIALAGTLGLVLPSGGSVSFVYGFVFCVLCNFAVTASLGEMAAIWPTAGGQYHFVYALCTEKWKRPMSFCVGWITVCGWLVVVTVQAFFSAQFICAASVVASEEKFIVTKWNTYLIFLAILTFGTVSNIWGNKILGKWNDFALGWSVLGAVVIAIVLLSMHDKTEPEFVFADFSNETGWPDGMAWLLGLLQSALSLIAFDVILHMTEEMPNPSRDAPRAMVSAIGVGGVTGLGFILAMLFCLTDAEAVLTTSTGQPIVELIFQATNNRAATCILTLLLAVCFINGTVASITSASRLLFSMARDRGIVFPDYFSRIQPGLNVPVRAIVLCWVFNCLFGLLYLGPVVAFGAYLSSVTILLNVSYALPIITLLVRGRGVLAENRSPTTPFQFGKIGYFINWVAVLYVVITSIFFFFPVGVPVDGDTMNYVVVVCGIFALLIGIYWFVYGHRFEGPQFDEILNGLAQGVSHGHASLAKTNTDSAIIDMKEQRSHHTVAA